MEREDNKANPHEQNGGPSDQINERREAEGQRKCSERSTIVPIYTISQSIIIKD